MAAPNWLWAKSAGSAGWDYAGLDYGSSTISTDQKGKSYITGSFKGPAVFGSINLTSPTYPAIFVAKYNTNGTCLWAKRFGGNDTADIYGNKGESIDIDPAGNCYVTGTFKGSLGSTITLAPGITLTGTGHRQIFIVKYSPAGNPIWAKQPDGTAANNYTRSISVGFLGECYITGYLGATGVKFGSTAALTAPGAFIAKYDTNGNALWATKIGAGNCDPMSIEIDAGSSSFITGFFQNTETINGTTYTSIGSRDTFIASVDSNGVFKWFKHFGFAGNDSWGRGISTDIYGNIFITGYFNKKIVFGGTTLNVTGMGNREAFIVKLNNNGNPVWAKQSTNSNNTNGVSIKALPTGQCFVTGFYSGSSSVSFTGNQILSNGKMYVFVAKYGTNGSLIWIQKSGDGIINAAENPLGISYDANLNIYIAGNSQGPSKFGTNILTAYGGYDAFIAKLEFICP
ncbi:MAG: SBBP repeat-containing protein [Candidatus Kapaibacterium sp.]